MATWALILLILASLLVGFVLIRQLLISWAHQTYAYIKRNPRTNCDIDEFVSRDHKGESYPDTKNPLDALKVVLAYKLQIGNRPASSDPIPIEYTMSPHVPNLYVTRRLGSETSSNTTMTKSMNELLTECTTSKQTPIIIATIRMGFGHHRLAYSTASWALQTGHPTIFHDLLNIKSSKLFCVFLCIFLTSNHK